MELLKGGTLDDWIQEAHQLDPKTVVSIAIQVADGLARVTNLPPGSTLTAEGIVGGIPAYMSPEQMAWPQRLDRRCDVYGLGVVLYKMLTGEVPFRGAPHPVLSQIELDEPLPPRRLNDAVPIDLETI